MFRKLSKAAAEKYDVRMLGASVFFPCYWGGKVVGYKVRDFSVPKKEDGHMRCAGTYSHMFGWHTVHTKKHLAIALGEFDAMAVYDACGIPALSPPNGDASLVRTIKRDLKLFDGYERIVFVLDRDKEDCPNGDMQPSRVAKQASNILGIERCFIMSPVYDDANEYLIQGKASALKSAFWSAVPASTDLWHESSRTLIQPVEVGRLTGWEEFDYRTGGLRMCETTYILGAPGSGKTTTLCWLMWLMSQRQINVGCLVLEGTVSQFVTKLACTYYGGNIFLADDDTVDRVAEQIDAHTFFAKEPENIEMSIRTAVLQHDCEVIVIDNITAISNPDEVYASTSQLVTMFDQLARDLCVHIIVLSHVKTQYYNEKPALGAASGSSGIEQKAYNIVALYKREEAGLLKCRKNGEHVDEWWPTVYDSNSGRFIQGARAVEWSNG